MLKPEVPHAKRWSLDAGAREYWVYAPYMLDISVNGQLTARRSAGGSGTRAMCVTDAIFYGALLLM